MALMTVADRGASGRSVLSTILLYARSKLNLLLETIEIFMFTSN